MVPEYNLHREDDACNEFDQKGRLIRMKCCRENMDINGYVYVCW